MLAGFPYYVVMTKLSMQSSLINEQNLATSMHENIDFEYRIWKEG